MHSWQDWELSQMTTTVYVTTLRERILEAIMPQLQPTQAAGLQYSQPVHT